MSYFVMFIVAVLLVVSGILFYQSAKFTHQNKNIQKKNRIVFLAVGLGLSFVAIILVTYVLYKKYVAKTSSEPGETKWEIAPLNFSQPLEFGSPEQGYYEFSNLYDGFGSRFFKDGKSWNSSEHYYQAMRFKNDPNPKQHRFYTLIQNVNTPDEARRLGGEDSHDHEIMKHALWGKFTNTENDSLRKRLIDTGDRKLIYTFPEDGYWSVNSRRTPGGNRQNVLGRMLENLRTVLRQNGSLHDFLASEP